MGLQAAAATKRKHEINFDTKDANTYTNCPPPLKAGKWSINNNNYIEAVEEQLNGNAKDAASNSNSHKVATTAATEAVAAKCPVSSSNNGISSINCHNSLTHSISHNGKEVSKTTDHITSTSPLPPSSLPSPTLSVGTASLVVSSMIPMASEMVAATTPLPPTSTAPVPEDSIAKLEEVAAVPCCEPWTAASPEPVDCISKLQAVAVPSVPWGSISTRSTLATTLLSADELDDDDDDFEDDYEEEESIIPTYCPLRYHPFSPAAPSATPSSPHQPPRLGTYAPTTHGYGTRPNYYSEPFPQQNCSRTGSPQHMRMPVNGFPQWQSAGAPAPGGQQFYVPPEAAYPPQPQQHPPPQQQQQTIRCAENGKSYLELGCSSPAPSVSAVSASAVVPPPPFGSLHVAAAAANLDARHPMKRCCDGRGTWCNTNKNCYKDVRLKIRNLSMFKLSRFRQVSEQSLYRSVLICNTLKRIDREIEAEAKEMHQVAVAQAAAAQQQHQYHQHHHPPLHLQHHLAQQQQQQSVPLPPQHLAPQQPHTLLHQQHQDYTPVMNCARLANMDYQVQQQQQQQQQAAHHQQQQHFAQLAPQHYLSQPERLDTPPPYMNAQGQHLQKPGSNSYVLGSNSLNSSSNINNLSNSNCDSTSMAATSTLHPYDHYPFRESQSGRATPFPCQPPMMIATTPVTPASASLQQTVPTTMSVSASQAASTNASSTSTTNTTATSALSAATSTAPPPANTIAISTSADTSDSGYADDDSTRTAINWSSVLSLSSQSALDPLNNNDLFAILPPALSVTNPATAVPVPVTAANSAPSDSASAHSAAVSISGTFTTIQSMGGSTTTSNGCTTPGSSSSNSALCGTAASTAATTSTATFTTLSTISSATHSLTSSYVSSMSSNAAAAAAAASSWEYGFLDMEFGLGTEFTELVPSCKLSSDELFKSSLTPVVAASRYSAVHDNELEQPAHIMVGS